MQNRKKGQKVPDLESASDKKKKKTRIWQELGLVARRRMDINREMLFMPFEELLTEGPQRQRPSRQEQESNLRNSLVRVPPQLWKKLSSP